LSFRRFGLTRDELTIEPLMEALGQGVGHELLDHVAQMPLAKENEVVEALVLDRLRQPTTLGSGEGEAPSELEPPPGCSPTSAASAR
jgi:hypothetical protein